MKHLAIVLLFSSCCWGTWVSPTSHNFGSNAHWDNCGLAYDGDIETFANESDWPPYFHSLDLFFSDVVIADKFRINAANYYIPEISNPSVEIVLFCDDEPIMFYVGSFPASKWFSYPLGNPRPVSGARITSQTTEYTLRIHEFQLNEVPEPATILLLGAGLLWIRSRKSG